MAKKDKATLCPCGSGKNFEQCCGRFLSGKESPQTPEELMRSRYTAYVVDDMAWIEKTWDAKTRPENVANEAPIKWLGLEIRKTQSISATEGRVEYVARGRSGAEGAFRMHAVSVFEKRDTGWIFVDDVDIKK